MTDQPVHVPVITVCVCTFKRAELLERLLLALAEQRTDDRFTYSVVIADNDAARSAEQIVATFAQRLPLIKYCVEPRQNIALARNLVVAQAHGDYIAFIDDDEFPTTEWLSCLLATCMAYRADAVLGPVKPHFEEEPPEWLKNGKFFDRPTHPTGFEISWPEARSGNVLFKREILAGLGPPFAERFDTAGEDVDFFRRLAERGRRFVWCDEAVAYESVPPSRCTRTYLLKRALLRGSNFPKHPTDRVKNVVKSLVAVPCYTVALPLVALLGQHVLLRYLIKLLDHSSRLCAFMGLRLLTRRQT